MRGPSAPNSAGANCAACRAARASGRRRSSRGNCSASRGCRSPADAGAQRLAPCQPGVGVLQLRRGGRNDGQCSGQEIEPPDRRPACRSAARARPAPPGRRRPAPRPCRAAPAPRPGSRRSAAPSPASAPATGTAGLRIGRCSGASPGRPGRCAPQEAPPATRRWPASGGDPGRPAPAAAALAARTALTPSQARAARRMKTPARG